MIQKSFHGLEPAEFPAYPSAPTESGKAMLEHLVSHLAISPISATHYRCTPEWKLEPRKLQNSYWTYLIEGHGSVKIEDEVFPVGAGDLILFPEGVTHSFDHPKNGKLEMINVHFHAKVYGLMDFLSLNGLKGVFREPGNFPELISKEMARAFAFKPPCHTIMMAQMTETLLLQVLYHSEDASPKGISGFKQLLKLFPALVMVEQRLEDPDLKQYDLAAKLRISEVYLRKMFNGLFKESPVKFINHRRIERACKLLRESDLPVKAVAEKSGFRNLQFFYRVFSRITGMTPARYRNTSDF